MKDKWRVTLPGVNDVRFSSLWNDINAMGWDWLHRLSFMCPSPAGISHSATCDWAWRGNAEQHSVVRAVHCVLPSSRHIVLCSAVLSMVS